MANDPFLDASGAPKAGRSGSRLRIVKWVTGIIVIVLLAYYPIGMLMVHKIDDDPDFKAPAVPNGASQSVAVASVFVEVILRDADKIRLDIQVQAELASEIA